MGDRPPAESALGWLQQDDVQLLRACQMHMGRRRGPGGQHRNKVSTAVVLEHLPTGVRGEASERRSQAENRRQALLRLRVNLALHLRHRLLDLQAYQPSPLWQQRCLSGRISVSASHRNFACLLAEALDVLAAAGWQTGEAADRLGCSPSQLVKLLKLEPRAMAQLNQHRTQSGLKPLS